ncbi:hypothetical protein QL285_092437 [Trifolium repens]|nr:hypothetical protein QL285_092437 [Trifolium repens]
MGNNKRRSSSEIDGTTPNKIAYNLRHRSQRTYEDLSDSEIGLHVSLQNSKSNSTADNKPVVLALKALKTADNSTLVAQRSLKTNTNMMKTELVEPDTNLTTAGSETSNLTTCEENVAGGSGTQNVIQIGQESPNRVPILPDLNLEPCQEDM